MASRYGSTIQVSNFEASSDRSSSSSSNSAEEEEVVSITDALSTKAAETSPLLNNSNNNSKNGNNKGRRRNGSGRVGAALFQLDVSWQWIKTRQLQFVQQLQSLFNRLQNFYQNYVLCYWTLLVFDWFTPLLHRGNAKKTLDRSDLDLVPFPEHCDTDYIYNTFDAHWHEEMANAAAATADSNSSKNKNKNNPQNKHILVRALCKSFGREFVIAGLLKLVHDSCLFVGPQVLHAMIYYLRHAEAPLSQGLGLTALVTASQLAMSFCLRHYFFTCYLTGLKLRTSVVVAVYQKALHVAAGERQTRTVGEITNLMSIDAQRLQGVYCVNIHYT